jgi:AraC-like DNA-binding protein
VEQDILSLVLRELRFDMAGYGVLELCAPWGLRFEQAGLRGIHIVSSGRCQIVLNGVVQELAAGDLVVTPSGEPHVLRSPGAVVAPVSMSELSDRGRRRFIRAGGGGEQVNIVCGAFVFHEAEHPALSALPPLIHVPAADGTPPSWLAAYVDVLMSEARDPGPGSELVLGRLSGALVARALRHHVEHGSDLGWLNGLREPPVARAMALMHEACERPWTVATLARAVGLSRAAFAARFTASVGHAPMRYLLTRRMLQAMQLLRDGLPLAAVAERVGYGSEASLSTAFKRHTGIAPGDYRARESRASSNDVQNGHR